MRHRMYDTRELDIAFTTSTVQGFQIREKRSMGVKRAIIISIRLFCGAGHGEILEVLRILSSARILDYC